MLILNIKSSRSVNQRYYLTRAKFKVLTATIKFLTPFVLLSIVHSYEIYFIIDCTSVS